MSDRYALATVELGTHAQQLRQRQNALAEAVAHCRAEGVPWSVIGAALGVTKQAAQQRYGERSSTT